MTYNKSGSSFYKTASRIKSIADNILSDLDRFVQYHPEANQALEEDKPTPSDTTTLPTIGNLEPPLSLLTLFDSPETIEKDLHIVLSDSPISSLFSYEHAVLKPPPPPKPTRTEMLRRKKEERKALADASPGLRGPKTRRALAAAAAFEAEAGSPQSGFFTAEEHEFEIEHERGPEHEPEHEHEEPEPEPESEPHPEPEHEHEHEHEAEPASSVHEDAEPHPVADEEPPQASTSTAPVRTLKYPNKKGKRTPLILPGQSEVPPMVDDVDSQKSFKMFDAGWILPPDQKRHGRVPVERKPLPPPKKRQKTGATSSSICISRLYLSNVDDGYITFDITEREKSHLSTFSTSAAENETLNLDNSPQIFPESLSVGSEVAMSVDEPSLVAHVAPSESEALPPIVTGAVVNETGIHPTIFPQPPPEAVVEVEVIQATVKDEPLHEEVPALEPPHLEPPSPEVQASEIVQPEPEQTEVETSPTLPAVSNTIVEVEIPPVSPEAPISDLPGPSSLEEQPQEVQVSPQTSPQISPRRKKKEPRNVIIIEELDTPAIRREKNQRRREEKLRLKAQKEAEEAGIPFRQAGPSGALDMDLGSELSSLSDLSGDEDSSPKSKRFVPPKAREPGEIVLAPGAMLEGGTLGTFQIFC